MTTVTTTQYAPPPGPPPMALIDPRLPLLPTTSRLDLNLLASRGWLSLPLDEYPELRDAYADLFNASTEFFALPDSDEQKTKHAAASGTQASEEGYSRIPGEKQILTCKSVSRSPGLVAPRVRRAWDASGALVSETSRDIARSLGLPADTYTPFVDPCASFPPEKITPTLLRMFRYERPVAGNQPRVVAEAHRDLGLLSIVIGHTPGLDVLVPPSEQHPDGEWVSIEEPGPHAHPSSSGLTATLLCGQVLALLSLQRYRSGVHRVSVRPTEDGNPHRFSLVFALRPAPVPVHTDFLESAQTGKFPPAVRMRGESMAVLFERIMQSHWNINVEHKERNRQKKNLGHEEEGKKDESETGKVSLRGKIRGFFSKNE